MMAASKEVNRITCSMEKFSLAIVCSKEQCESVRRQSVENFDHTEVAYTYCQDMPTSMTLLTLCMCVCYAKYNILIKHVHICMGIGPVSIFLVLPKQLQI